MHPLDGAYVRVQRADKHLSDLKRREGRRHDAYKHNLTYDFNPVTQLANAHWRGTRRPLSPNISIILGEIIYNLRAALDYLVYELAFLDSGQEQDRTQFPIESTKEGFKDRRHTFLKGVNDAHVAEIKRLQPRYGCKWTKILVDISNPDKHRKLTDSKGTSEIRVRIEYGTIAAFLGRPGKIFPAQGRLRGKVYDVYVEGEATIEISFADWTPVVKTLELLKSQVADTLDAFKPEFK